MKYLPDLLGLLGTGLLAYGSGMIYLPAAPIVAGAILLVISWRAAAPDPVIPQEPEQ